jgi:quercetin dioxygenase-like cupin family protein
MSNVTQSELDQLHDLFRDPVVTDSDKYKVVLENERVRVLEYRDSPGQRTSPHHHPDFVLCALSAFKRKFVLSDGREAVREVRPGEVAWGKAHSHIGENAGSTDTHVLIVELK